MTRKEEAGRKLKNDGDANSQVREWNSFLLFFFGGVGIMCIYSMLGIFSKILWLIIIFHEACMSMNFWISFLAI